jgi:hypothetical protein
MSGDFGLGVSALAINDATSSNRCGCCDPTD